MPLQYFWQIVWNKLPAIFFKNSRISCDIVYISFPYSQKLLILTSRTRKGSNMIAKLTLRTLKSLISSSYSLTTAWFLSFPNNFFVKKLLLLDDPLLKNFIPGAFTRGNMVSACNYLIVTNSVAPGIMCHLHALSFG